MLRFVRACVIVTSCLAVALPLASGAQDNPRSGHEGIRLRVLTLNMYGLRYPPQVGWLPDKSDCAGRFKTVAERIRSADPPYDIVAIQELYRVWDLGIIVCDPAPFLNELEAMGTGRLQEILFSPTGRRWQGESDGGMGLLTPHSLEERESLRFEGAGGTLLAARGVVFGRIAIPHSGTTIDAYVVHLSPGRQQAKERKRELGALTKLVSAKSLGSGNPVIVLGDFNIAGPPDTGSEYSTILEELGHPRDMWLVNGSSDSGFTYDCISNATAALRGCDYQVRIDYVWVVTDRALTSSEFRVRPDGDHSIRLVEWNTPGRNGVPVSDHYGLEATLRVERSSDGVSSSRSGAPGP